MNQAQKKKVIKPLYTHWKKMPGDTLRAVLLDFKRWCAEGKLIINKQGHAVPFILNEAQEKVAELVLSKAFAPILVTVNVTPANFTFPVADISFVFLL